MRCPVRFLIWDIFIFTGGYEIIKYINNPYTSNGGEVQMSVTIYIDESGTHSNRFMIISALMTQDDHSRKRIKNLMKKKLVEYRRPKMLDELHAYHLTIPERQDILTLLAAQQDYQVAYLVADKHHITPKLLQRPNLCYNYLYSHLIRRITDATQDDISIISDNRSVAAGSKNSLPEYIQTQAYAEWGFQYDLKLCLRDSRDVKGLQAVDIISNAIYSKFNSSHEHLYNIHNLHYQHRVLFPIKKFGS